MIAKKEILRRTPQASSDIPERARSTDRANLLYRISMEKEASQFSAGSPPFLYDSTFYSRTALIPPTFCMNSLNHIFRIPDLNSDCTSREIVSASSLRFYVINDIISAWQFRSPIARKDTITFVCFLVFHVSWDKYNNFIGQLNHVANIAGRLIFPRKY